MPKTQKKSIILSDSDFQSLSVVAAECNFSNPDELVAAIAQRRLLVREKPVLAQVAEPTPDYLRRLLPSGGLGQTFFRAMRLWAIVRSLPELELDEGFAYPEWRDAFFSRSHPSTDEVPDVHDPKCRCAMSIKDWLKREGINIAAWKNDFHEQLDWDKGQIDEILSERLFAVTRRSLSQDIRFLRDRGLI